MLYSSYGCVKDKLRQIKITQLNLAAGKKKIICSIHTIESIDFLHNCFQCKFLIHVVRLHY